MPFFRGATDIVISGGDFNDISGNLVVNDTSERVENFRSHNTDDVVEVDSSNTSWARHGGQARSTRRPASREDTLPVYDNPNNFPTGTHTQAPVATAASAPTSTQPAEVDSRRAPSRANTMASDETDNDNDRMEE